MRMPESGSGQSFICKASICAATTAVGGSIGVGPLCSKGLLVPLSLMCCENSDARAVPACNFLSEHQIAAMRIHANLCWHLEMRVQDRVNTRVWHLESDLHSLLRLRRPSRA